MRLVFFLCCALTTHFIRCERQMDISVWYSDIVSRSAFEGRLTTEQQITKNQIEELIAESARTKTPKIVSMKTLESYEAIFNTDDLKDETEMDETEMDEDNEEENKEDDSFYESEKRKTGEIEDNIEGMDSIEQKGTKDLLIDLPKTEGSENVTGLKESKNRNVTKINSWLEHQRNCRLNKSSSYLDVFYKYGSSIQSSVLHFCAKSSRKLTFKKLKKKKSRKRKNPRTRRACKMKTRCSLRCWLSFESKMCIPRFNWLVVNVTRDGVQLEDYLPFPDKTNFEKNKQILGDSEKQPNTTESEVENKTDGVSNTLKNKDQTQATDVKSTEREKNFEKNKQILGDSEKQPNTTESEVENKTDGVSNTLKNKDQTQATDVKSTEREKNFEKNKQILGDSEKQPNTTESEVENKTDGVSNTLRNKDQTQATDVKSTEREKNFEKNKQISGDSEKQPNTTESEVENKTDGVSNTLRNKDQTQATDVKSTERERNFEKNKQILGDSEKQPNTTESEVENKMDGVSNTLKNKDQTQATGVKSTERERNFEKNKQILENSEKHLPFADKTNFEKKEQILENSEQYLPFADKTKFEKNKQILENSEKYLPFADKTNFEKKKQILKDIVKQPKTTEGQVENKIDDVSEELKNKDGTGLTGVESTEGEIEKLLKLKKSNSEEGLNVDRVTKIIDEKSREHLIKIQTLELSISKLENRILKEQLSKTNDSSSISRLENHILRLENELIKLNQTYIELRQDNEQLKKSQRRYLELSHGSVKNQSGSENYTLVIGQQKTRLTELTYQLRNQSELITKFKKQLEQVEDQNRMLYQIVMNQSLLMSQVMKKIQILSDQLQESNQKKKDDHGLMTPTELIKYLENMVMSNRKSKRGTKRVSSLQKHDLRQSLKHHRYEACMSKTCSKFEAADKHSRQMRGGLPKSATVKIPDHEQKQGGKVLKKDTGKGEKNFNVETKTEKSTGPQTKAKKAMETKTSVSSQKKQNVDESREKSKPKTDKIQVEKPRDKIQVEKPRDKIQVEKSRDKIQVEKPRDKIQVEKPRDKIQVEKPRDKIQVEKPRDVDNSSKQKVQLDSKGVKVPVKVPEKIASGRKKPLYEDPDNKEPKDCYDLHQKGNNRNGAYKIRPAGFKKSIEVFCDMKNGGWTVIQRRQGGTNNFFRDWSMYKKGFGGVYGEHWIGNDVIHQLTNQKESKLRIDLTDWDKNKVTVFYEYFMVEHESEGYLLHVEGFSGEGGDSFSKHNLNKFSTKDVDNDRVTKQFGGSCANRFSGAWWYHKCYSSNLNGVFYRNGAVAEKKFDGIAWKSWKGPNYSMMKTEMKIAPAAADTK